MKLLFVVQRYGRDVPGGAENACRDVATRLAARDHDVHAVTSCARSYVDWADVYPPGEATIDGVTVHRLPVRNPREDRFFGPMNARAVYGHRPVPLFLQQAWMRMQGPDVDGLQSWLTSNAAGFDAAVFFTYLYNTTWTGLPVAAGRVPTVLFPLAHDEPPIYLPLFDLMFRLPHALAFLSEEEQELVERRFRIRRPSGVIGLGVDLSPTTDADGFRTRWGLEQRPFLLYVGRLDPGKGTDELYDFFVAYKQRHPGPLALVVVGEPVKPLAPHPDVIVTGFLEDADVHSAMAACMAFVMPSYYESFSRVLMEAFVQQKPALVQAGCAVLVGAAQRSAGAIPYERFAQFEAAVDLLIQQPRLCDELGWRGREYVVRHFGWDTVLDHLEDLLRMACTFRHRSLPAIATAPLTTAVT